MSSLETFCLHVSGDFACFTRPEMKVERVSYDVITPSAARAVFEAILWKPAIRWQIRRIEVLNPVRWISIRRNEVSSIISERNVKTAMRGGNASLQILIEDDRQQRAGLFLRDVAYRLHACFSLQNDSRHLHRYPHLRPVEHTENINSYAKFAEMFKRRARKGQCFNQPYLGTREFSADFSLVENDATRQPAISEDRELGWMLYDMDFSDPAKPCPRFFNATMRQGVIQIPEWDSDEVRG